MTSWMQAKEKMVAEKSFVERRKEVQLFSKILSENRCDRHTSDQNRLFRNTSDQNCLFCKTSDQNREEIGTQVTKIVLFVKFVSC